RSWRPRGRRQVACGPRLTSEKQLANVVIRATVHDGAAAVGPHVHSGVTHSGRGAGGRSEIPDGPRPFWPQPLAAVEPDLADVIVTRAAINHRAHTIRSYIADRYAGGERSAGKCGQVARVPIAGCK